MTMRDFARAGRWLALLGAAGWMVGCAADDPEAETPNTDGGVEDPCNPNAGLTTQDNLTCVPAADDYEPRDQASANDSWPACVSDQGTYQPLEASVSTIARIGAFEEIATLLAFDGSRVPSAQDFLDARVVYTQAEGLESRVVRREDEHYPAAPSSCRDLPDAEQMQYADRCVGSAKIRPILNDAFQKGSLGEDRMRNAARIEAALLWFLYVSVHKEALTCAEVPKDCDSSYAYYTGGESRVTPMGMARYVDARSPQTHDRIWDGILAVRCWRDLDNPTGVAEDTAMQTRALNQLDRALLRGVALIVRQRLENLSCPAAWETVRTLGPVLYREAEARDATQAAKLREQLDSASPENIDVTAAQQTIDLLFPCP